MSEPNRSGAPDRSTLRLHAYADGELSGFARWRFERRVRRCLLYTSPSPRDS